MNCNQPLYNVKDRTEQDKGKSERYKEIEFQLIKELNDYISSCIKGIDLNKECGEYDIACLYNFKAFSEHMFKMYKMKLKKQEEIKKCT